MRCVSNPLCNAGVTDKLAASAIALAGIAC